MQVERGGLGPDRLTFVGHATVLLELAGTRLLTDPVLRPRLLHIRRRSSPPDPRASEHLDAILISHLHHDHLDPPSLRRVADATPVVAPVGSGRLLRRRGIESVIELAPSESVRIGTVDVTAIEVAHDGRRYPIGAPAPAFGYLLESNGTRVFFAGDTAPMDLSRLPRPDLALLPIGGWGPRLHVKHHLGPRTAAQLAADIGAGAAVPIHWGTLLRADLRGERAREILERPARDFRACLAELAPATRALVLDPGESTELPASG